MAGKNCLKVLSYAFKEISLESFNELMHTHPCESAEFRQELETDLIYLGTFGVEDPLIDDIHCSVQLIRFGRLLLDENDEAKDTVNVRMVTGDHLETARAVAIKSGIVTESEANTPGVVMTGDDFLDQIKGYEKIWDASE